MIMKLVIYSIILNNHQACVADELWELTNHSYCFVELVKPNDSNKKGGYKKLQKSPLSIVCLGIRRKLL